jgi:uridylate kinase
MVAARKGAPVVLSVGGSLLRSGDVGTDARYWAGLVDLLRGAGRLSPLLVTTGGGRPAREYIELGRRLGLTEVGLDELGIEVTRLHAHLLAARLGPPTPPHPPASIREAVAALAHASPVVMGGTEPGHTTDAVAALLAARLGAARLVNATDVDGVYDRDPRGRAGAERHDRLSWAQFRTMVERGTSGAAGQNFPFDRLGAETLARAGVPLLVVDGHDLANVGHALTGRPFVGTFVGEAPVRRRRRPL